MLNLNTGNDYSMAFSHHLSSNDQQFYHNLYANATSSTPAAKDKNEFLYKNQKFDFINNNTSSTVNTEMFSNLSKDCENSKRFSVNNLLKAPLESSVEKLSGKAKFYYQIA